MAHIRQSKPDAGLGFQAKVLTNFEVVPFSLVDPSFRALSRRLEWTVRRHESNKDSLSFLGERRFEKVFFS